GDGARVRSRARRARAARGRLRPPRGRRRGDGRRRLVGRLNAANTAVRAAAVVVDAFVVAIVLGIPVSILSGQARHRGGNVSFNLSGWAFAVWVALSIGYWTVCEAAWGMTIGKRLFSIRVVGPDGAAPSWGRSAGRNVLRIVDAFPYVVPYLL